MSKQRVLNPQPLESGSSEPIEAIERRSPNECLAIIVTKTDRDDVPIEGVLLYHTPNRKELLERFADALSIY